MGIYKKKRGSVFCGHNRKTNFFNNKSVVTSLLIYFYKT